MEIVHCKGVRTQRQSTQIVLWRLFIRKYKLGVPFTSRKLMYVTCNLLSLSSVKVHVAGLDVQS